MTSLRVPLYPVEEQSKPTTFCVTGATGYVASAIVKRLLAQGHTVHATVRNVNSPKNAHLLAMDGASDRLKLFEADCLKAGSFDEAVKGCKYVIHTASPVIMQPKKGKEMELLIEPAIRGVDNCINAVNACEDVEAVVLTSSYFAIWSDNTIKGPDHVFSEEDWNELSTERSLPYARSKVVAEQRAWELYKQQSRWRLAVINPAFVVGPPEMANAPSETVTFMRITMKGELGGVALPLGWPFVDVEDVAAAHILAALNKNAQGRHLCVSEAALVPDAFQAAIKEYPEVLGKCKIGLKRIPRFIGHLLGLFGVYPAELIKGQWDSVPKFTAEKARKELGMNFMPLNKSIHDMAVKFVELGEVKLNA